MNAFGPTVTQFLRQGAAREFQPALVEKNAQHVRAGDPDHHRRRVGHMAEALFAFTNLLSVRSRSLFHLFPFGDIAYKSDAKLAFGRLDNAQANLDRKKRAVLAAPFQIETDPQRRSLRV